jgi:hypothetical protein
MPGMALESRWCGVIPGDNEHTGFQVDDGPDQGFVHVLNDAGFEVKVTILACRVGLFDVKEEIVVPLPMSTQGL